MGVAMPVNSSGAIVLAGGHRPPPGRGNARAVAAQAPRLVGPASILASSASLQVATALATTVFATFGPAGSAGLRLLAGACGLLAVTRPDVRGRPVALWVAVAAFGAAMAATSVLLYAAVARIPLGTAVTLEFLGPLALAFLAARRRLDAVSAVAAAAGVFLVTGGPASGGSLIGVGCALGAAVTVAASILAGRRVAELTNGNDGLALSVAAAALLTLPVSLPAALATPGIGDLVVVAAVGVLGIALPYALELTALRRVGVRTYSILLSLDPAVAGLAGLLFLGQQTDLAQFVGVGLVVAASIGAVATRRP